MLQRLAYIIPMLMLVLLLVIGLGNLAGYDFWPLSKLVHFSTYWGGLALLLGLGFTLRRRWWTAAVGVMLALGFGAQVGALWREPAPRRSSPVAAGTGTAAQTQIRVMTFNVLRSNPRRADVLAALQVARPDVLYLTEMDAGWHQALAPLSQIYPHRLGDKSNLLLSRYPLEDAHRVPVTFDASQSAIQAAGGAMPPLEESLRQEWPKPEILTATVIVDGRRLRLAGIHPPTPRTTLSVLVQRATALICQQELQTDSKADARMLVGDFNTTCFSPTFRFIIEETGLRDSAQGFGYTPTRGPRLPRESILPWIGIPIDHQLVSENMEVLTREVGPTLGSDHRWVMAKLQW